MSVVSQRIYDQRLSDSRFALTSMPSEASCNCPHRKVSWQTAEIENFDSFISKLLVMVAYMKDILITDMRIAFIWGGAYVVGV